jgi:hypothetical protein
LAFLYKQQENWAAAKRAVTEDRPTPWPPRRPILGTNLALAYQDSGRLARGVTLSEETLEKTKAKLGPDHPNTLQMHEQPGYGVSA